MDHKSAVGTVGATVAQVLIYTGFGADFIKKNKMSPDGLAQMAWQALAL